MTLSAHEPSAKYLMGASAQPSAAGDFPPDWTIVRLKEVAEVRGGIAKNANVEIADPVEVAYLRVANVQDGYLNLADVSTIKVCKTDLKRYSLMTGDVLMNEGGDLDKLGRGALWRREIETCVHQNHVFAVRCKPHLDGSYLNVWTGSTPARRYFLLAGKQTTNLASISKSSLGDMPVAMPRLAEQRAIATALSDVDALIAGLERLIAKKRNIKQAAMQQLLTGQTRLPGFSGEWSSVEIGEVAVIRNVKIAAASAPRGTMCVELESICQGTGQLLWSFEAAGATPKYTFKSGDVLFGRLRAYLRKYWRATFDGICSTEIWPLIPRDSRLTSAYLYWVVQTEEFIDAAAISYGTHMPRSDWLVLKRLSFQLPPSEEQTAIATFLSDMDADLAALEARLTKTRAIKQGMMQELLTGRTRLV